MPRFRWLHNCSIGVTNLVLQRDIPGFTRAAVPVLVDSGVKAVTLGVNGGSAPPDVPYNTPFLWRDIQSGTELIAMWHPGDHQNAAIYTYFMLSVPRLILC